MKNPITIERFFSLTTSNRLALLLTCLLITCYCFGKPHTTAVHGILDLGSHNWAKDGIIDLNGDWAFYWDALYTPADFDSATIPPTAYADVPDFWNKNVPDNGMLEPAFGYATYRLTILCPPQEEKLQIKFLTVASAYKLFVNGQLIAEMGKVGTSQSTTTPAFHPAIYTVTPVDNRLDIVVQVANYTYNIGGLWDFIKLGTEKQIQVYHTKNIAQDFFIAGSFFLIAIFHIVIYYFFEEENPHSTLLYSVYSLASAHW